MAVTVFANGILVLPSALLRGAYLTSERGRITAICWDRPKGDETIDLGGRYLALGLLIFMSTVEMVPTSWMAHAMPSRRSAGVIFGMEPRVSRLPALLRGSINICGSSNSAANYLAKSRAECADSWVAFLRTLFRSSGSRVPPGPRISLPHRPKTQRNSLRSRGRCHLLLPLLQRSRARNGWCVPMPRAG